MSNWTNVQVKKGLQKQVFKSKRSEVRGNVVDDDEEILIQPLPQNDLEDDLSNFKIQEEDKKVLRSLAVGRPETAKSLVETLTWFEKSALTPVDPVALKEVELSLEQAKNALIEKEKEYKEAETRLNKARRQNALLNPLLQKNRRDLNQEGEQVQPTENQIKAKQEAKQELEDALSASNLLREEKEKAEALVKRHELTKLVLENKPLEAQKQKERLLNAVRFGPLSKPTPDFDKVSGLNEKEKEKRKEQAVQREKATAAILADMKDYPELALEALELVQNTDHPEAFIGGVGQLGKLLGSKFGDPNRKPEDVRKMTRNALKMAGVVGGDDYFQRMEDYYKSGDALTPDENRVTGTDGAKKTTMKYTNAIGTSLMKYADNTGTAEVDLKPNDPNVMGLRNRLLFHPDSLKDPMPALAQRVETFVGALKDEETQTGCKEALNSVTAPLTQGGKKVVDQTVGEGVTGKFVKSNRKNAQASVLSAMLTPLTQGSVGSCFATCNCMDYQDTQPVEMMKDLAMIVNTGTLSKGGLDPVPVVVNLPPNENGLLRSFEYTVATLGARVANSNMKKKLNEAFKEGLSKTTTIEPMVPQKVSTAFYTPKKVFKAEGEERQRRSKISSSLHETLAESIRFTYEPTLVLPSTAQDGKSTMGGWAMMKRVQDKDGVWIETKIEDEKDFKAHLKETMTSALGKDGDPVGIDKLVEDPEFMKAILSPYTTQGKPWRQDTGGRQEFSKKVLFGGEPVNTPFFEPKSGDKQPQDRNGKTKLLLGRMVETLKNQPGDTVTLDVDLGEGGHAYRALPKHSSLDSLKDGDSVETKVEEVFEKAKKTATQPLAPEQTTHLYDKTLQMLFEDHEDLKAELLKDPPLTEGKTPQELKTLLLNHAKEKLKKKSNLFNEKTWEKTAGEKIDGLLIKELYSEFVLADTNWGDSKKRTYQVVAPDPMTGEAQLWDKDVFSGSMQKVEDKWIDYKWGTTI